jgi:hypothetical protein
MLFLSLALSGRLSVEDGCADIRRLVRRLRQQAEQCSVDVIWLFQRRNVATGAEDAEFGRL